MIPIESAPEIVEAVWFQYNLPVIYRSKQGKILVKLPWRPDNKKWLRGEGGRRPEWKPEGKYWSCPRTWYDRVLRLSMARFGAAYTIRPVQNMSKCAPACWDAKGPDCHCSCNGENHGRGIEAGRRWNVISETLAVEWGPERLCCTLLLPAGATVLEDDDVEIVPSIDPPGLISRYAAD
jgi:hypothetical protein